VHRHHTGSVSLLRVVLAIVAGAVCGWSQPYAYVANQKGNTVSVVNRANSTVTASIPVGGNPSGMAITPDGSSLYVAAQSANNVAVISTSSNSVSTSIAVGSSPVHVAITPDGTTAYVVNQGSNNVSAIKTATHRVIATITVGAAPAGIAITPDGTRALVTNFNSASISVITTATNTVTATWGAMTGPSGIAISPDGNIVYVANQYANTLTIHDAASGTILASIAGLSAPNDVAPTPNGAEVYVTNSGGSSVSVINGISRVVTTTVKVGTLPTSVGVTANAAYVTNGSAGSVSLIGTASNTVTTTINNVGTFPVSVVLSPPQLGPSKPSLPKSFVNTTYPTVTGQSIVVHAGGDFQGALNNATCGDEIVLDAGAVFTGNFNAPSKGCSGSILVRSSRISSLPAGVRVQQSQASLMPAIVTPNTMSVLGFSSGAAEYYFAGLNFTAASGVQGVWNLITLSANATSASQLPRNIVFDRVLVHGNNEMCVRGFLADAVGFGLINSQVYDFVHNLQDTQAVLAYNSPGPYEIYNNYLESTGENIMFGGADPTIPNVIPSDATIRRNFLNKLFAAWDGQPAPCGGSGQQQCYDVKNTVEIKDGQRILLDSNIFSYSWGQGQGGSFVVLTPRAQCYNWTDPQTAYCTAPWAVSDDVIVTNNLFQHGGTVFFADGTDSDTPPGTLFGQSNRVLIQNNLGTDLNAVTYQGAGQFGALANTLNWTINHNTSINTPGTNNGIFFGDPPPSTDSYFTYTNNLIYGPLQANAMDPLMVLAAFPPNGNLTYDVFVGDTYPPGSYPPSAHFFSAYTPPPCNVPTSGCTGPNWALVGFVNFAGGNYQLAPTSPYHNAGSDGTDIGANVPLIMKDISGVAQ
jgi:YVTN family beta-propeller protein